MKSLFRMTAGFLALTFCFTTPTWAGPGEGGGGNTVGDKLFDDYVVEGSVVIPAAEIERLTAPYLNDLDRKVPGFATALRQGIKGIVWYKEPKLLNQTGVCLNGADTGLTPTIGQVVRACQNKLEVKIEKDWYEQKLATEPTLVAGLLVHELLVYQRIRNPKIIESGVLRMSRAIRSMQMSDVELQSELKITDFGKFETVAEALQSVYKKADSEIADICIMEIHSPRYRAGDYTPDLEKYSKRMSELMNVADAKTVEKAKKQKNILDKSILGIKGKNNFNYCAGRCLNIGCE